MAFSPRQVHTHPIPGSHERNHNMSDRQVEIRRGIKDLIESALVDPKAGDATQEGFSEVRAELRVVLALSD